jgi:hypothetical protein
MKTKIYCLTLAMSTLVGCSSILSGQNQIIAIKTTPEGAKCEVSRNGANVANLESTPGELYVEKTKDDLTLVCSKSGYLDTETTLSSGVDPTAYGNIFLGGYGLITWGIDSALGTDNQYPKVSSITLGSLPNKTNIEKTN